MSDPVVPIPEDKASRMASLKFLYNQAVDTLSRLTPDFILQELPNDDDEWEEFHDRLQKHVGIAVARAKLLAVGKDLIKEMAALDRKDRVPDQTLDLEKIKRLTDPKQLDAIIAESDFPATSDPGGVLIQEDLDGFLRESLPPVLELEVSLD